MRAREERKKATDWELWTFLHDALTFPKKLCMNGYADKTTRKPELSLIFYWWIQNLGMYCHVQTFLRGFYPLLLIPTNTWSPRTLSYEPQELLYTMHSVVFVSFVPSNTFHLNWHRSPARLFPFLSFCFLSRVLRRGKERILICFCVSFWQEIWMSARSHKKGHMWTRKWCPKKESHR